MPHRGAGWVWAGRLVAGLAVVGLVVYLFTVGLDQADKVGSATGVVVAVLALVVPYLLPARSQPSAEPGPVVVGPESRPAPDGLDVRGSQGTQINLGGTNTQNNTFGSP